MKSYTDTKQSKKLAEFLPLESADMTYRPIMDIYSMSNSGFLNIPDCYSFNEFKDSNIKPLPCWSLSALLGVLSFPALRYDIEDGEGGWIVGCEKNDKMYLSHYRDNPVDTCYEMILKLHEQKLL